MLFDIIGVCDRKKAINFDEGQCEFASPLEFPPALAIFEKTQDEDQVPSGVICTADSYDCPSSQQLFENRPVFVITSKDTTLEPREAKHVAVPDFPSALDACTDLKHVWVLGDASLYEKAFTDERCRNIHLVSLNRSFKSTQFLPIIPDCFNEKFDPEAHKEIRVHAGCEYFIENFRRPENSKLNQLKKATDLAHYPPCYCYC